MRASAPRRDNRGETWHAGHNLVGCQTHLGNFSAEGACSPPIPALRNAEFARYGVMHRNTFARFAPRLLVATYATLKASRASRRDR